MRNSTLYKLAKPITFRRSSCAMLTGHGSNLQNIEKSLREIYIPDGYTPELQQKCTYWLQTGDVSVFSEQESEELRIFLQTDQSGAEALIVAYDCDPLDYRQLFIHNVKPHVYVAMKLFKDVWTRKMKDKGGLVEDFDIDVIDAAPIGELKKNPFWKDLDVLIKDSDNWSLQERYYYLAKQTVHSANYDIQWATFQMNILEKSGGKIAISKEEAERFLMVYRGLFPEIPERNRRVQAQAERYRLVYNMFGMPYQITDWNVSGTSMKDIFAWLPQSTVGEITRIAFTSMQEWIEENHKPFDVLADTHDSFLVQCPLRDVKECAAKMSQCMNQELISPVDSVHFHMKSETNIGFNWRPADLVNKKNIVGLQAPKWL